jgi:iron complex outermembrane receptor protein
MKTSFRFRAGLSTLGLCAALASPPAWAQGAPAPAEASQDSGIADIVVTAQRREETLQRAALAIDAVTGGGLVKSGITDAFALTKAIPALTVTSGGGSNASLYLRGVGNTTTSSYADPAIAISYDGVFMGRSAAAFGTAFYDLERVEVLKGPQGILYGRNATGGAINVIPARPKLGDASGGFTISTGNYKAVDAQAFVNLPLGENAALRVAGTHNSHDGYNRDGTSDLNTNGVRAQLLFKPTDTFSIRLAADYTKLAGKGTGSTYEGNYNPGPSGYVFVPSGLDNSEGLGTPAANAYRQTLIGAPGFGFLGAMQDKPFQDYDYWGVNAEVNYETGIGTFTFLPAYRKSSGASIFQVPSFNSGKINETDTQYSFEGRLAGKTGPVDYIVGGYFFHEKIDALNTYNQEYVLPLQNYIQSTRSFAGFGQLTFHVSDRLRLVGGARYTKDHKRLDGTINNFITFCGGLPPANIVPPASFAAGCAAPGALPRYPTFDTPQQTVDWLVANGWIAPNTTLTPTPQVFPLVNGIGTILKTDNPVHDGGNYSRVTWKASAEFDVAPDSLLYATFETGYRAGGFQLSEGRTTYKPEFLDAYTIGSKNRFLGGKLQLNIEAFLWKYRDQQITYFTVDPSGTLISSTENVGRMTTKGVDVDVIVKPARHTLLNAKIQYLDATYNNLHLLTAPPRDNIGCPGTPTGATAGGAPVIDFDCSGRQAVHAPKWAVNLGGEQRVPVGDFQIVASINTSWRDTQQGGFEYLSFQRIPAYWSTDVNLALESADNWTLSAYMINVENNRHRVAPVAAPTGQAVTIFTPPRTYGVRLSARF